MSLIIISHPFADYDDNICSVCLDIQLRVFRHKIMEQWNRYNNDGRNATVKILFSVDTKYPWERPVTMVAGSYVCITHMFININRQIEMEAAMTKPRLDVANGSIDGFLKKEA